MSLESLVEGLDDLCNYVGGPLIVVLFYWFRFHTLKGARSYTTRALFYFGITAFIAPFVVIKNERRESQPNWLELLNHVKSEGKRDSSVQRYKGLGEMNAEQLADTTMNPEKRTLLQVRLEDIVECEQIFSTLMGENVESRRKFIEDNALDVRNLDV